jgi:hypothetical protein
VIGFRKDWRCCGRVVVEVALPLFFLTIYVGFGELMGYR